MKCWLNFVEAVAVKLYSSLIKSCDVMLWCLIGGLETEGEYPYKGEDEKCSFAKQDVRVYINGSVNISKNEDGVKAVISLCHDSSFAVLLYMHFHEMFILLYSMHTTNT